VKPPALQPNGGGQSIIFDTETRVKSQDFIQKYHLARIVDMLTENVHEVHVEKRVTEGCKFGIRKDERLRTDDTLVPFFDLREEDKERERNVVGAVLRTLLHWGYWVIKLKDDSDDAD